MIGAAGICEGALRWLRSIPLDETVSLRELAVRLRSDRSYATVTVDELARKGYATCAMDPEDRRYRLVELTDRGREVAIVARGLYGRAPAALNRLNGEALLSLRNVLQQLVGDLDAPLPTTETIGPGRDRESGALACRR